MKRKNIIKTTAIATAIVVAAGTGVTYLNQTKEVVNSSRPTADTKDATTETASDEDTLTNTISNQVHINTEDNINKEETVYVMANANGATNNIIVSDHLKNFENSDTLKDASDLDGIVNVKGDEEFTPNSGNSLTWKANGSDIYYQGTTDKALPVDVKIAYYLDDKVISPEDIAGKSGSVKIRFDYTNHQKSGDIYVPFTMVSGLVLPSDCFENVSVSNGKVISDGNKNIVMGLAFPGLKDSLNLDSNELEIPDYVEVTADATNFELGMTMTFAVSDLILNVDINDFTAMDDLQNSMTDLSDASSQLMEGSTQLNDGLNTLQSKSGTLVAGVQSLSTGANTAKEGSSELSAGTTALVAGATELDNGATTLNSKLGEASGGTSALLAAFKTGSTQNPAILGSANALATGASNLNSTVTATVNGTYNIADYNPTAAGIGVQAQSTETLITFCNSQIMIAQSTLQTSQDPAERQAAFANLTTYTNLLIQLGTLKQLPTYTTQISTGTSALSTGLTKVTQNISDLNDGLSALYEGSNDLASGTHNLYAKSLLLDSGAKKLDSGIGQIVDGTSAMSSGSAELVSGVNQLTDGSLTLKDGLVEFDEGGVQKLVSIFDGDLPELTNRLQAIVDAGHSYSTFTELPEGMKGSVKFIIKTEGIEAE